MKASPPERSDYIRSAAYILIYVVMISANAVWLLPESWFLWGGLVAAGLVVLVSWHRSQTVYQCPECGHLYEITFWVDLISPHGVDGEGAWLLLRCPSCRLRRKTRVLKRVD